jgi:hypothetical protein
MKEARWTNNKPRTPGHYWMRDKVFGWMAHVVVVDTEVLGLVVLADRGMVSLADVGHWIFWKEVGHA